MTIDDLKFDETRLDMLVQRLNEVIRSTIVCRAFNLHYPKIFVPSAFYQEFSATVGELLIAVDRDNLCLRSYINIETFHLLDGEF